MRPDPELTDRLVDRLTGLDLTDCNPPKEEVECMAVDPHDVLRPSGNWSCERYLALLLRELPVCLVTPVDLLPILTFGRCVHRRIQAALSDWRHEVAVRGPWLVGSLDTLADSGRLAIEWKTINARSFSALRKARIPKRDHSLQASWYALHAGAERVAVVYILKTSATSAQIDNTSLLAFSMPILHGASHPYDIAAHRVLGHHTAGTLPTYEEKDHCRYCQLKVQCWRERPFNEPRTIHSKLVGQKYRTQEAKTCLSNLTEGCELLLVHEPENIFDLQAGRVLPDTEQAMAVQVCLQDGGRRLHLGYLPAAGAAPIVADHLARGGTASCTVSKITSGHFSPNRKGQPVDLTITLR